MINIDKDVAREACIWLLGVTASEMFEYLETFPEQALVAISLSAMVIHPRIISGAALLFKMLELQEERNKTKELSELFKLEDKR